MNKLTVLSLAVMVALAGCSSDDNKNENNIIAVDNAIAVGSEQCINGGVETQVGADTNNNDVLDSDEVNSTNLVCNAPATSLTNEQLASLTSNAWFSEAQTKLGAAQTASSNIVTESGKAKNVILFVGDGMGISTITAARILAGQLEGEMGEEHQLSFETMPFSGFVKTYNVDAQTPDSAGTMTAMASGVKTDAGVLGIDEAVERGNCASGKGHELVTSLELAEIAGKATGIISTARITHATPAATYAKSAERNWEDISDMPESAATCEDIASQLVNFEANLEARFSGVDVDGIDVVMGGGRRHFLANDVAGEPSLSQMTEKAINVLDNNEQGFFLTVESGRIDHAHHAGNAYNALNDTIELAKAVKVAMENTNPEETLIVVTADHSHVFTIAGYPKRGNPILGKVVAVGETEPSLAADDMPYTTVGYTNGLGYRDLGDETNADASYLAAPVTGRVDLSDVDTTTPGFHQESLVPLGSETHAGEDVGVYAMGPGAHLVTGTNEQSFLFHVMDFAADFVKTADEKLAQ